MRRINPLSILGGLFLLVLLCIALYSLRYIPAFELKSIEVSFTGKQTQVPSQLKADLAMLVGTNLFKLRLSSLEKQFGTRPAVKKVALSRMLPRTLKVLVTLVESPVVIHALDENGVVNTIYLVDGTRLEAIAAEDEHMWTSSLLTVEIPRSYAELMEVYGVDENFNQVMALTASLKDTTSLITRIKYDNNSSNSFGKMVLELSSLNAQIWVREPVGMAQVRSAVALVAEDQKDYLSFLSSGTQRYDLYRGGMVRR